MFSSSFSLNIQCNNLYKSIRKWNRNNNLIGFSHVFSKSLAPFSVFGSSSGGENEEILQELKEMKVKQEEAKSKAAKFKSAKRVSNNETRSIFELAETLNKSASETEDNNNNSIPPSGNPSVELLNKLRESGRNIDNSNVYDRFAAAMKYKQKKK